MICQRRKRKGRLVQGFHVMLQHDEEKRNGNKMAASAHKHVLTGICLLIEDCSLIIQPVPRKK